MKTKLLFGLAATSAASLFWACGSGEILKSTQEDELVAMAYTDGEQAAAALQGMVETAVTQYCQGDANCVKDLQGGAPAPQAQTSSSAQYQGFDPNQSFSSPSNNNNNNNTPGGQSSGDPIVITNPTTSSNSGGQTPSSNPSNPSNPSTPSTPTSSNSTPAITSGGSTTGGEVWGDCVAGVKNNTTTKGSEVTWTVTPKKVGPIADVSVMRTLTYTWNFQGGDPATVNAGATKTAKTKYTSSGTVATTVTMTTGTGLSQVVQCPALEVTGAPVSGCTCKAAKLSADIKEGVSWTVSGCVSEDQNFTYAWSEPFQNVTTAVLSGTVASKGQYKPTVRVKNGDNGLMDVTCDEVVVTDSENPDVTLTNGGKAITLQAGKTYAMTYKCATQFYQGKVSISSQSNASVTWAYGTKGADANVTPAQRVTLDYSTLFGSPTYDASTDGAIISLTVNSGTVDVGCE